ncbi:hypothetical protein CspeluHIS016_0102260 [Cutaneotrichosporon spelunceum]|uniref:Structural maintenance of chromosomes protein 5 n=1 Tax=Cutaneotrichosporon spelunceum TaxID=1672016 RepID=A0AAD3TMZ3_9TREE|nr:hypothetical protein CspeluHIS016_0102260 [Cutaneotrichosporon spelunceum]
MSQRRPKRRVQEVSDDDEVEKRSQLRRRAHSGPVGTTQSQSPIKGKGRAIVPDSDEEMESDNDELAVQHVYRPELERGEDGYIAGSIVRVKIVGFMTYDHVEFRPGPHLNMILGPNGTGKSSIAAAIAIGLGFHPKVMGRAHDVRSYVKQGTEVAEIEIELKGHRRKANPVIWRRFGRDSDKSEWRLNDKGSTRKAIQNLIQSFGVQADNLCSFLPQDKVADFAKMNPVTVLKETMRAAGDPNLSQWHEDLVANGKAAREVETSLTTMTQKRDTLRRQVDELEPEVRNYERQQDLKKQLHIAEVEAASVVWKDYMAQATEHKKAASKVKDMLKRLHQKQAPLRELQVAQEFKEKKAKRGREGREAKLRREILDLENADRSHRSAIRQADGLAGELEAVNENARKIRDQIKNTESLIRRQQEILASPDSDKEALRAQLDVKLKAQQKAGGDKRAADAQRQNQQAELERIRSELSDITISMNRLSQDEAENSNVEAHRRRAVFGNDSSIEFATFVCQNQEDYSTLLKLNRMRLPNGGVVRLNLATIEAANPGPPHLTHDQVADLGLDGFAVDFIEAEPAMRTFLCQVGQLDRIGITLRPHSQLSPERLLRANILTWFSSTHFSRAVQSRYGKRDMQITTNALPGGPHSFLGMTVDQDAVKRIADEMADLRRRQRALEQPQAKVKLDIEQSNTKIQAFKDAQSRAEVDIGKLREELNKSDLARENLGEHSETNVVDSSERYKNRLNDLHSKPTAEAQRKDLRSRIETHAKSAFEAWKDYMSSANTMVEICGTLDKSVLLQCQAESNVVAIEEVSSKREGRITELGDEHGQHLQAQKRAKDRSAQQLEVVQDKIDQTPAEYRREAKATGSNSTKSVDEARAAVQDIQGQLELSLNVDGNTIERYSRLKHELEAKEHDVARAEGQFEQLRDEVASILSRFNPALDSLVQDTSAKFSAAFERIGCTGEVRVSRVQGNYAEWGIEILVSYRDGQDLEVLTASRQSGGERSLATVTYLMSLSEMARTPFSLVDEINQGMDARAERSVHNQMVKVTCAGGDNVGQYFLITPKLLTDLDYHENMRVLTVSNGSYLPDGAEINFGALSARLATYKHNLVAAR